MPGSLGQALTWQNSVHFVVQFGFLILQRRSCDSGMLTGLLPNLSATCSSSCQRFVLQTCSHELPESGSLRIGACSAVGGGAGCHARSELRLLVRIPSRSTKPSIPALSVNRYQTKERNTELSMTIVSHCVGHLRIQIASSIFCRSRMCGAFQTGTD